MRDHIARGTITERLENWARWATARNRRGSDCMTGVICESMRKAALGNVWSGNTVTTPIAEPDALAIERGMRHLTNFSRLLLHWRYITQALEPVICRKLSIKPPEFAEKLCAAHDEIEQIVDSGK